MDMPRFFSKQHMPISLKLVVALFVLIVIFPGSVYAAPSFELDSLVPLSNSLTPFSGFPQMSSDGNNVYVLWSDGPAFDENIFFIKSTDNGQNFDSVVDLTDGISDRTIEPKLSSSGTNVNVAWSSLGDIFVTSSNDGGSTFSSIVNVSNSTGVDSLPQIVSVNSDVHVAWTEGNHVMFSASSDGGATFDVPKVLNTLASGPTDIRIYSINGVNVYVTWVESGDVFLAKSDDGGSNFDAPLNISNSGGTIFGDPNPVLSINSNFVYVLWRESTSLLFDISNDGGDSFSGSAAVLGTVVFSNTKHHDLMSINDDVYVAWTDNTISGGGHEIQFRHSSDNGASFDAAINVSDNPGISEQPLLLVDDDLVFISWIDDSTANNEILFAASDDNTTFGNIVVSATSGNSNKHKMALSDNNVVFVWADTEFGSDVLFKRASPTSSSIILDKLTYKLSDTPTITVSDSASNLDDSQIDSILVSATSSSDPAGITITLDETMADSGEFSGTFRLVTSASVPGNSLHAIAGDDIDVEFGTLSTLASIFPIIVGFDGMPLEFDFGDVVHVLVNDPHANLDSMTPEKISVDIVTTADSSGITLDIEETGPDTGMFGGSGLTNLIFTVGDALFPTSGTITVTRTDTGSNTTAIDTKILPVFSSTTGELGKIDLLLTETGNFTAIFEGELSLSQAASTDPSTIHVSPGDILTMGAKDVDRINALIVPNLNPANGAIKFDFPNNDTATVRYMGLSSDVNIVDTPGSGGGGGAVIRPTLVFDAIGILGGSGKDTSPPSFAPRSFGFIPDIISDAMQQHNQYETIYPTGEKSDNLPFTINDDGFIISGYTNQMQTSVAKTGEPVEMRLIIYETNEIQHITFYTNLLDRQTELHQSDTYITYDSGQPLEIVDPHGYFDAVDVEISEVDDIRQEINYEITFAKPMDTTDVVFRMWDEKRNSGDTQLRDVLQVIQNPDLVSIPKESVDRNDGAAKDLLDVEEPFVTESREPIPEWIKFNSKWWHDGQITDDEFVKGLEFLIDREILQIPESETSDDAIASTSIPDWIQNTAGWWAQDLITEDDFVAAIQYLISNKIINITN